MKLYMANAGLKHKGLVVGDQIQLNQFLSNVRLPLGNFSDNS